jgi:excisionase family DNA binding protein
VEDDEQSGSSPERWYTIKQIVEALGVHEQTVRQWIHEGRLPAKLFGRRGGYRILARDYESFLDSWPSVGTGKAAA